MSATPGALSHVQLHLVSNLETLWACARWAGERREGPLCADTESAGLDPHRHRNRLIQLGDMNHGWAFPADLWGGAALEILTAYAGEIGFHNSPYDVRVMNVQHGWQPRWERTHDTLIATHLLDSMRDARLKVLAGREVDPRAVAGEKILHDAMSAQGWTWATVPVDYPGYWAYGALDPVLTAHLWHKYGSKVLSDYPGPYDLERATTRIAVGMMTAGMRIDRGFIREHIETMGQWQVQAMEWLKRYHGITTVNSNEQLGRAFERAGIQIVLWTPKGKPQMDKEALAFYRTQYPQHEPLIKTVIKARKVADIIGDHLTKYLSLADANDHVHCTIHTCRARTSRMSVTEPALQTLDRDEPVIRGCFVPDPGEVLVTIDADQIEARLCAHFSGDRRMIEMFHHADVSGISFFRQMMGDIYGIPYQETSKKDPRYTWAKNATYSWTYGAGLDKMAVTAGVTQDQMSPIYYGLKSNYPGVVALMKKLIREGRASSGRPYVTTPFGRRLYGDPGKEYALLNTLIQGHAGEILKNGAVKLDAAGMGRFLRLFIHDEIMMSVPKSMAAEVLAAATEILTDRTSYAVPLTWGGAILEDRWVKQ